MRATAVFSCLCLLVAAWLLLVTMRGALDGEQAFRAAVACAPGSHPSPDGGADDCLRTVSARIDRTEAVEGRKSSSFWMYLTEADGTSSRTRLTGTPREHPDARAGARIDVTYWQEQIRYVDLAADAAGPGAAFRLVGVCGVVVLAVCALAGLAVWWRQRGDDTIALTPSVPDTEQHFPGVILGEVPYAGRGGHLDAGPAGPATARDWPVASAHREVPRTLTPIRVRPSYWTDPAGRPDYDRVVVLECEDDGVPVLIATRRKKMPWVLGALGAVTAPGA
jgi:hypothetical protein